MKARNYLITGILISYLNVSTFAQTLVFETEYKVNKVIQPKAYTIQLANGGLILYYFQAQNKLLTKTNLMMVAMDSKGKKIFEIDASTKEDIKGRSFEFIYNRNNGDIFGIDYSESGSSIGTSSNTAHIIRIKSDGSYIFKKDIKVAKHVAASFFIKDQISIIGLNDGNKRHINDDMKIPSGEFEATIMDRDLNIVKEQKLTIPKFEAEMGYSKNKLIGVDETYLYFVTEGRFLTKDDKIAVVYDFLKYDFANNKVESTKTVPMDFGKNCPRPSNTSILSGNQNLMALGFYDNDYPNIFYHPKEKAFFILSSYGEGYPKNTIKRQHEGNYILRFNTTFDLDYSQVITATPQMLKANSFTSSDSYHYLELIEMKGKNYFVCASSIGLKSTNNIYDIDLKKGKATHSKNLEDESAENVLLKSFYSAEFEKAKATTQKDKFVSTFIPGETANYLIISDLKTNKFLVYSL